jgi:GNAT superfamily N-acetyltransferase
MDSPDVAPMHLRRLASGEVDLHRDLRLRALRDVPDSFGDTFAQAASQPRSYWEDLTRSVTEPARNLMFLACRGADVLGSTYGLLDRERADTGRVGGMWVDPAWRRHGVGRALLEAVLHWARERGFRRLGLWAAAHNPAAIALYARAGFEVNGGASTAPEQSLALGHCDGGRGPSGLERGGVPGHGILTPRGRGGGPAKLPRRFFDRHHEEPSGRPRGRRQLAAILPPTIVHGHAIRRPTLLRPPVPDHRHGVPRDREETFIEISVALPHDHKES